MLSLPSTNKFFAIADKNYQKQLLEFSSSSSILLDFFSFQTLCTAYKESVFGVVLIRIQSECGKMRTRITPNTDSFYAVSRHIKIKKP